ncbi:MAG: GNAT family N-acetyltransferase [Phycisphaerales bacterium]|nr:GNAT family N-acetyltransferase [Phycisphaerales bacterium]
MPNLSKISIPRAHTLGTVLCLLPNATIEEARAFANAESARADWGGRGGVLDLRRASWGPVGGVPADEARRQVIRRARALLPTMPIAQLPSLVVTTDDAAPHDEVLALVLKRNDVERVVGVGTGATLADAGDVIPWLPVPPRVETERLILTWPTREQTQRYYERIVGTDIFDNLTWDGPRAASDLFDHLLNSVQEHAVGELLGELVNRSVYFAIIEKASGEQIGGLGYRPHQKLTFPQGFIGYSLNPEHHGRGLGTEAVGGLVDHLFTEGGVGRIEAEVFVGNTASARVLEKLGFTRQGLMPGKSLKRGELMDEWFYALNKGEWSSAREC